MSWTGSSGRRADEAPTADLSWRAALAAYPRPAGFPCQAVRGARAVEVRSRVGGLARVPAVPGRAQACQCGSLRMWGRLISLLFEVSS